MASAADQPPIIGHEVGGDSMQVAKIHDVQRHLEGNEALAAARRWPRRIGVINAKIVRVLAFIIISAVMIGSAFLCVMAVWGSVAPEVAWRALATLGIVALATAVFVSLNEGFGPLVRS